MRYIDMIENPRRPRLSDMNCTRSAFVLKALESSSGLQQSPEDSMVFKGVFLRRTTESQKKGSCEKTKRQRRKRAPKPQRTRSAVAPNALQKIQ